MAEITANGLRTHIQHLGNSGPTVVFVHGILVDNLSSLYFTLANPVAKMAQSVLYDLRGHGKTERPTAGYFLDDLLADLDGVIDGVGVDEPVYLVGHSYGGLLAISYGATRPERVAGIAAIDPPLPLGDWGERIASLFTFEGPEKDQRLKSAWESMHGGAMSRKLKRMEQAANALVDDTSLMADMRGSRALASAELAAIRCPVLAIYGDKSEILDCGERLAELVPHADVRLFPDCTHRVLFEATDKVKQALLEWLQAQFDAGQRPAAVTG